MKILEHLTAHGEPDDIGTLSFLRDLADAAAWRRRGLAWASFEDGQGAQSDPSELESDESLLLAADDRAELSFPANYEGDGWLIVVGRDLDGGCYVAMDAGHTTAEVVIGELRLTLSPGGELAIGDLLKPPTSVELVAGGVRLTLKGVGR